MDAWETRYGSVRVAAIDRLEQLCLEKYHLKMPSPASNATNKVVKKKTVDVSQLKAPEAIIDENAMQERPSVKAGKITVTARPHGLKGNAGPIFGKLVSSSRNKSLSSPEAMSTGGDSERSRSPSPPLNNTKERLDNEVIISTTSNSSNNQTGTVDNAVSESSSKNSAQDNMNANVIVDNASS